MLSQQKKSSAAKNISVISLILCEGQNSLVFIPVVFHFSNLYNSISNEYTYVVFDINEITK